MDQNLVVWWTLNKEGDTRKYEDTIKYTTTRPNLPEEMKETFLMTEESPTSMEEIVRTGLRCPYELSKKGIKRVIFKRIDI